MAAEFSTSTGSAATPAMRIAVLVGLGRTWQHTGSEAVNTS